MEFEFSYSEGDSGILSTGARFCFELIDDLSLSFESELLDLFSFESSRIIGFYCSQRTLSSSIYDRAFFGSLLSLLKGLLLMSFRLSPDTFWSSSASLISSEIWLIGFFLLEPNYFILSSTLSQEELLL